jgi:hypothetical protein
VKSFQKLIVKVNCHCSMIHTDVLDRGLLVPTGHADFYVNGGFNQPGCADQTEMSPGSCNHDRAPVYYAESINSDVGFWGYQCGKRERESAY